MTTGPADLRHIETWLFDLDDTLYPLESGLMDLIRGKIAATIMRITGLDEVTARETQRGWLMEHGAALPGFMAAYKVDPAEVLAEFHDVPIDAIGPDPALDAALGRLPGRKLIFTNGSAAHADRILERIGIAHHFEAVFHIEAAQLVPKPAPETFDAMIRAHGVDPKRTCFFEDSPLNLRHAADLGMTCVLVGPHALAAEAPWVAYRSADLVDFLTRARVRS